jgi:hypothetical protein
MVVFPVKMRLTPPAFTYYNPSAANNKFRISNGTDGSVPNVFNSGDTGVYLYDNAALNAAGNVSSVHLTADADF